VQLKAVVDLRPEGEDTEAALKIEDAGVEVLRGWCVYEALPGAGKGRVRGAKLCALDGQGAPRLGETKTVHGIASDAPYLANGRTLHNHLDWESVKLDLAVGDTILLVTRRGTLTVRRTLVATDLPTRTAARVTVLQDLQLVTVTPAIQAERGIQSEQGALVVGIAPRTAESTGLRVGDVIIGLDRRRVASATDLSAFFDELRSGESFRIWLERNGQTVYTDLVYR
jgi:hypothetical protein